MHPLIATDVYLVLCTLHVYVQAELEFALSSVLYSCSLIPGPPASILSLFHTTSDGNLGGGPGNEVIILLYA